MLQLRLLLHTDTLLALTHTLVHPLVPAPTPTTICIPTATAIPILIPISTHTRIPIATRTLTLSKILMSAPPSHTPIRPNHGIPPHLSLLAGSCHLLHRHKEPTFIKGLLRAAL